MIRITRSQTPPARLISHGPYAALLHSAVIGTGTPLTFDKGIYGHVSVKEELVGMQNHKCAFCEAKVTHVAYGDVEHFRPKGGVRQDAADKLSQPGYWWLAYEWENLLFACQVCNGRHKGNLFPLKDPKKRCGKPTDDLNSERPIFINPADPKDKDPETLIDWRGSEPVAVKGNIRARVTIAALGLDDQERWEPRRKFYRTLKHLWDSTELLANSKTPACVQKAKANRAFLADAVKDSGEYAGMIRAAMRKGFSGR